MHCFFYHLYKNDLICLFRTFGIYDLQWTIRIKWSFIHKILIIFIKFSVYQFKIHCYYVTYSILLVSHLLNIISQILGFIFLIPFCFKTWLQFVSIKLLVHCKSFSYVTIPYTTISIKIFISNLIPHYIHTGHWFTEYLNLIPHLPLLNLYQLLRFLIL